MPRVLVLTDQGTGQKMRLTLPDDKPDPNDEEIKKIARQFEFGPYREKVGGVARPDLDDYLRHWVLDRPQSTPAKTLDTLVREPEERWDTILHGYTGIGARALAMEARRQKTELAKSRKEQTTKAAAARRAALPSSNLGRALAYGSPQFLAGSVIAEPNTIELTRDYLQRQATRLRQAGKTRIGLPSGKTAPVPRGKTTPLAETYPGGFFPETKQQYAREPSAINTATMIAGSLPDPENLALMGLGGTVNRALALPMAAITVPEIFKQTQAGNFGAAAVLAGANALPFARDIVGRGLQIPRNTAVASMRRSTQRATDAPRGTPERSANLNQAARMNRAARESTPMARTGEQVLSGEKPLEVLAYEAMLQGVREGVVAPITRLAGRAPTPAPARAVRPVASPSAPRRTIPRRRTTTTAEAEPVPTPETAPAPQPAASARVPVIQDPTKITAEAYPKGFEPLSREEWGEYREATTPPRSVQKPQREAAVVYDAWEVRSDPNAPPEIQAIARQIEVAATQAARAAADPNVNDAAYSALRKQVVGLQRKFSAVAKRTGYKKPLAGTVDIDHDNLTGRTRIDDNAQRLPGADERSRFDRPDTEEEAPVAPVEQSEPPVRPQAQEQAGQAEALIREEPNGSFTYESPDGNFRVSANSREAVAEMVRRREATNALRGQEPTESLPRAEETQPEQQVGLRGVGPGDEAARVQGEEVRPGTRPQEEAPERPVPRVNQRQRDAEEADTKARQLLEDARQNGTVVNDSAGTTGVYEGLAALHRNTNRRDGTRRKKVETDQGAIIARPDSGDPTNVEYVLERPNENGVLERWTVRQTEGNTPGLRTREIIIYNSEAKRGRGRPKKEPAETPVPKRPRGRPRKEPEPDEEGLTTVSEKDRPGARIPKEAKPEAAPRVRREQGVTEKGDVDRNRVTFRDTQTGRSITVRKERSGFAVYTDKDKVYPGRFRSQQEAEAWAEASVTDFDGDSPFPRGWTKKEESVATPEPKRERALAPPSKPKKTASARKQKKEPTTEALPGLVARARARREAAGVRGKPDETGLTKTQKETIGPKALEAAAELERRENTLADAYEQRLKEARDKFDAENPVPERPARPPEADKDSAAANAYYKALNEYETAKRQRDNARTEVANKIEREQPEPVVIDIPGGGKVSFVSPGDARGYAESIGYRVDPESGEVKIASRNQGRPTPPSSFGKRGEAGAFGSDGRLDLDADAAVQTYGSPMRALRVLDRQWSSVDPRVAAARRPSDEKAFQNLRQRLFAMAKEAGEHTDNWIGDIGGYGDPGPPPKPAPQTPIDKTIRAADQRAARRRGESGFLLIDLEPMVNLVSRVTRGAVRVTQATISAARRASAEMARMQDAMGVSAAETFRRAMGRANIDPLALTEFTAEQAAILALRLARGAIDRTTGFAAWALNTRALARAEGNDLTPSQLSAIWKRGQELGEDGALRTLGEVESRYGQSELMRRMMKYDTSFDDVQGFLSEEVSRLRGQGLFDFVARGRRPVAESVRRGQETGLTPEQLLAMDRLNSDEQALLMQYVSESRRQVLEQARVHDQDPSEANGLLLQAKRDLSDALLLASEGHMSEAGRALHLGRARFRAYEYGEEVGRAADRMMPEGDLPEPDFVQAVRRAEAEEAEDGREAGATTRKPAPRSEPRPSRDIPETVKGMGFKDDVLKQRVKTASENMKSKIRDFFSQLHTLDPFTGPIKLTTLGASLMPDLVSIATAYLEGGVSHVGTFIARSRKDAHRGLDQTQRAAYDTQVSDEVYHAAWTEAHRRVGSNNPYPPPDPSDQQAVYWTSFDGQGYGRDNVVFPLSEALPASQAARIRLLDGKGWEQRVVQDAAKFGGYLYEGGLTDWGRWVKRMRQEFGAVDSTTLSGIFKQMRKEIRVKRERVGRRREEAIKAANRHLNKKQLADFKNRISGIADESMNDAEAMRAFSEALFLSRGSALRDRVLWAQQMNMLSGLGGMALDVTSTAMHNVVNVGGVMPVSGALDAVYSRMTGAPRSHYTRESGQVMIGLAEGFRPALEAFHDAVRFGQAFRSGAKVDVPSFHPRSFIGKAYGAAGIIRGAINEFQHTIMEVAGRRAMAYRIARKEGATGDRLKVRTQELLDEANRLSSIGEQPEGVYGEILQGAEAFGDYSAFMDQMDSFGRGIYGIRNSHFLATTVIPFVRTLYNYVKRGLELSPLIGVGVPLPRNIGRALDARREGVADPALRKDVMDMTAKQIVGAALMLSYMAYADEENTTGAAPANPRDREEFHARGKLPYSQRMDTPFGEKWVPLAFAGPAAFPITAAIALRQKYRSGFGSPPQENVVAALGSWLDFNVMDVGAMKSLTSIFDPWQYGAFDEKRAAKSVGYYLSSYVPYSAFLRALANSQDPYLRETEGLRDIPPLDQTWWEGIASSARYSAGDVGRTLQSGIPARIPMTPLPNPLPNRGRLPVALDRLDSKPTPAEIEEAKRKNPRFGGAAFAPVPARSPVETKDLPIRVLRSMAIERTALVDFRKWANKRDWKTWENERRRKRGLPEMSGDEWREFQRRKWDSFRKQAAEESSPLKGYRVQKDPDTKQPKLTQIGNPKGVPRKREGLLRRIELKDRQLEAMKVPRRK